MTTARPDQTQTRLRVFALILGAGLLLWLPVEDTHERWAVLFAAAINAWFAARYLIRPCAGNLPPLLRFLLRYLIAGLLAGLAVAPLASFLMVFKTGLHGHGFPDFTPEQIVAVLHRTPIFASSGFFLGLGSGLAVFARLG